MLSYVWPQANSTFHPIDPLTLLITPTDVHFPFYHFHRPTVIHGLQDTVLSLISPLVAYWTVSIFFTLLDYLELPSIEKYRLHEPEEVTSRNRVTPKEVVQAVLLQQVVQTVLGLLCLEEEPSVVDRDYLSEMRSYAGPVATMVCIILPPQHARWVLIRYGKQMTQWAYWWAVPVLQYLWAS